LQEAAYINDSLNVPVYLEEIPLPVGSNGLEYNLKEVYFEKLESKISGIGTEIKINVTIVTECKQKKARITFIPLRINPENGQSEKLVSFEPPLILRQIRKSNSLLQISQAAHYSPQGNGIK